jgi:hypothetical protein
MSGAVGDGSSIGRGLIAHKQALVTTTARLDRNEANDRKRHVSNSGTLFRSNLGDEEFDIREHEALISVVKSRIGHNEDTTRIPVLSTLAGLLESGDAALANQDYASRVMAMLRQLRFSGIAMTAVNNKPLNPYMNAPRTDLATQLSGVVSMMAVVDMPLGAWVRLAPPDPQSGRPITFGRPEGIQHTKARLDPRPEEHGNIAFGTRLQNAMYQRYWNPNGASSAQHMTPGDLVFRNVTDQFENMMLTTFLNMLGALHKYAVQGVLTTDGCLRMAGAMGLVADTGNGTTGRLGDAGFMRQDGTTQIDGNELRRMLMRAAMPGMYNNPTIDMAEHTMVSDAAINTTTGGFNPGMEGDFLRKLVTCQSKYLASVMDAVRQDSEWVVGRVTRAGKTGEIFDFLM